MQLTILNTIKLNYDLYGIRGVWDLFKRKTIGVKRKVIPSFSSYIEYFIDKKGLEIGGPSPIFSYEVPIYPIIHSLDGCNFSNQTVWEGTINPGNTYSYFGEKKGVQFIGEAGNLRHIKGETYDFLISSHCLEHCANALKTVEEWIRVLKKNGSLLLVLPDKRYTFDHYRSITTFEHLIQDYNNGVDEDDLTHLPEILKLHDLKRDLPAGNLDEFKKRSLQNLQNRCLHHHVFDMDLLKSIYLHFNLRIVDCSYAKPYHQIIMGIKQ